MKTLMYIVCGVFIGLLAAGIIWMTTSRPRGTPVALLPTYTPGELTVYVSGAVATPGVYALPLGSRVDAAIQAAGGYVSGAESENINLAALLEDGQQIDVPGIANTSRVNAGRVDINTATVVELDTLPGIGPTTAQEIVNYRLEHGPFQFIQDIQNVPGIGPGTFESIRDLISIGPQ